MRGRPNAKCPRCGSLERHRALWIYLTDHSTLLAVPPEILHMAPEPSIERALRALPGVRYTAADLDPERRGIIRADITALPFADASFDLILCNHVLEHVPADRAAMSELFRVLRPGGTAIIQNPVDARRAVTYEDPNVVTPEDRLREFGQRDHVRVYGRDFRERLTATGFTLTVESPETWDDRRSMRSAVIERGSLYRGTDIHVCAKPPDAPVAPDRP
jgi:SAM-dependent methyltransferase